MKDIRTNEKSQGRGHAVPDYIIEIIASIYQNDPDQTAKEITGELHKRLQAEGKQYREGWPGESWVRKKLKKITPQGKAIPPKPEDNPWCVLDMSDKRYPIHPEVLPAVLKAWTIANVEDKPLTIREIQWVDRLYYVFIDSKQQYDVRELIKSARQYATEEKAAELTGIHPTKPQDMWWRWFQDAVLHNSMIARKHPGQIPYTTAPLKTGSSSANDLA